MPNIGFYKGIDTMMSVLQIEHQAIAPLVSHALLWGNGIHGRSAGEAIAYRAMTCAAADGRCGLCTFLAGLSHTVTVIS